MEIYNRVLDKLVDICKDNIPNYQTINDNDPFIAIQKLIASLYVSTTLYNDRYIESNYIQTININNKLNKLVNVIPQRIYAITLDLILETTNTYTTDVQISKGSKFNFDNVVFTNFNDCYLLRNNSYVTVNLIEGTYISNIFNYQNIQTGGKIYLPTNTIDYDNVRVSFNEEQWTKYDGYANVKIGKYFSLLYDNIKDKYYIQLSSNYIKYIDYKTQIVVEYIKTEQVESIDKYSEIFSITSSVIENDLDIKDRFKVYSVKGYSTGDISKKDLFNLLNYYTTNQKTAINTQDYKSIIENYNNIIITAIYDVNSDYATDPDIQITTPYIIKCPIAPYVGMYVENKIKEELLEKLRDKGLTSNDVAIVLLDPRYVLIDIDVVINTTSNENNDLYNIKANILNSLEEAFKNGNINFASTITREFINNIICKSDDRINYIDLTGYQDKKLGAIELPRLGAVNVTFNLKNIDISDSWNWDDSQDAEVLRELQLKENVILSEQVAKENIIEETWSFEDGIYQPIELNNTIYISEITNIKTFKHIDSKDKQSVYNIICKSTHECNYNIGEMQSDSSKAPNTTNTLKTDHLKYFEPIEFEY